MDMHGIPYMYQFHWFWMFIWFAFWILIIVGLFFIIRSFMCSKTGNQKRAIDILEERYAKGEILRDEYLEKKKDIAGE